MEGVRTLFFFFPLPLPFFPGRSKPDYGGRYGVNINKDRNEAFLFLLLFLPLLLTPTRIRKNGWEILSFFPLFLPGAHRGEFSIFHPVEYGKS